MSGWDADRLGLILEGAPPRAPVGQRPERLSMDDFAYLVSERTCSTFKWAGAADVFPFDGGGGWPDGTEFRLWHVDVARYGVGSVRLLPRDGWREGFAAVALSVNGAELRSMEFSGSEFSPQFVANVLDALVRAERG